MLGPRGEIIPLPVSALAGTPCGTYLVPGLILFTVLGVGPLGAAVLAWRRYPIAPLLALGVGRRSFALLRPVADTNAQETVRELILAAYAEYEQAA